MTPQPLPKSGSLFGAPTSGRARSAEMAARYGAETSVLDWRERLVCSKRGSREIDMVVTGTKR